MDGKHIRLQLGGAPVNLGRASGGESGTQIVMTAGPGGHFTSGGTINGKSVRFLVDTGATLVSMSEADADRIGLKYRDGERGHANTANGSIEVHRVKLDVIRIGDVQVYNVEALVGPMPMENILLGNSFLGRFQMKRENDRLTLDRRL
jgi:aspartyl protease family protein